MAKTVRLRGDIVFGYLQPRYEELKIKDFKLYKSVYCGLCKSLGKNYGVISRFVLNYDCTLLAMLYISLRSENCSTEKGHCVFNPLKKCLFCAEAGEGLRFAGAVSVITAYFKLCDTIRDSGFLKKTVAHVFRFFLRRSYKKAIRLYPEINNSALNMTESQIKAEQKESSIDESAEPTAKFVSALCEIISSDDKQRRILSIFGYFLGRWIYIMDAADDLENDIKHNRYNPFKKNYNGDIKETIRYCGDVLNMTVSQLTMAYDLLETDTYKEIIDNVIYYGLSFRQSYCLVKKYGNDLNDKNEKGEKQ